MEMKTCPFCGEQEYDLVGLKFHLECGECEKYNETERVDRMFCSAIFKRGLVK